MEFLHTLTSLHRAASKGLGRGPDALLCPARLAGSRQTVCLWTQFLARNAATELRSLGVPWKAGRRHLDSGESGQILAASQSHGRTIQAERGKVTLMRLKPFIASAICCSL